MTATRTYGDACGVARSLDVLGDRWALLAVRDLLLGPKRFNELHAGLPGVSPNVLSQRLHDLMAHGVVARRDLGAPARVHVYELTDWGRDLEDVLLRLGVWGSSAPMPSGSDLGLDSLLLGIKAVFDPARAADLEGVYLLRVDGDPYALTVADGTLRLAREQPDHPDAVLTVGKAVLRAVCEGRRSLAEAVASGDAVTAGEDAALSRLAVILGS